MTKNTKKKTGSKRKLQDIDTKSQDNQEQKTQKSRKNSSFPYCFYCETCGLQKHSL